MNYKLPAFLILLFLLPSFSLAGDKDGDGIPNKYDECPKEPEDKDRFEDQDGCPDPDNDKDGVLDVKDRCPEIPEDKDGFMDEDGCPDDDNDKDGIPDKKDKCPNEAEDFDNFDDSDGCPDLDNDKDGIPDDKDKCPLAPEDKDGFEDEDGCLELDNDSDGIKDDVDQCPNEKETFNGSKDEDGCPDTGVPPLKSLQLLPDVKFRTGTENFTFESFRSLDSLALQLKTYPDKQVKITIYREFPKKPEETLDLLARQHRAIIDYLVEKGATLEQFAPVDYSLEAYEAVKGTEQDYNQGIPIEVQLQE